MASNESHSLSNNQTKMTHSKFKQIFMDEIEEVDQSLEQNIDALIDASLQAASTMSIFQKDASLNITDQYVESLAARKKAYDTFNQIFLTFFDEFQGSEKFIGAFASYATGIEHRTLNQLLMSSDIFADNDTNIDDMDFEYLEKNLQRDFPYSDIRVAAHGYKEDDISCQIGEVFSTSPISLSKLQVLLYILPRCEGDGLDDKWFDPYDIPSFELREHVEGVELCIEPSSEYWCGGVVWLLESLGFVDSDDGLIKLFKHKE